MLKENYAFREQNVIVRMKSLQGKMLTIADAVMSDPEQRKGIKDLIKNEFAQSMQRVTEWAFKESNEKWEETFPEVVIRIPESIKIKNKIKN